MSNLLKYTNKTMFSKKLFLIRHGHAYHNELFPIIGSKAFRVQEVIDAPLTDIGHDQSNELHETIDQYGIQLVLVSPLLRALQTAHGIFRRKNIPTRCIEHIREYPIGEETCNQRLSLDERFVEFPDIDFSEIQSIDDIYWTPQRETLDALNHRIQDVKEYIRELPQERIAIVSHSSFLGQFKDKHIAYIENGETEMLHCWPLEYDLPLVDQPNQSL